MRDERARPARRAPLPLVLVLVLALLGMHGVGVHHAMTSPVHRAHAVAAQTALPMPGPASYDETCPALPAPSACRELPECVATPVPATPLHATAHAPACVPAMRPARTDPPAPRRPLPWLAPGVSTFSVLRT